MLLDFEKPKKTKSTEDWKKSYGFEDGPSGGYVPNMSQDDAEKWKAKLINKGKENARIEIRKSMGSQILIIVALDGWEHKNIERREPGPKPGSHYGINTKGLNVRMSMNGPLMMTFNDFNEIQQAVNEAKEILEGNVK